MMIIEMKNKIMTNKKRMKKSLLIFFIENKVRSQKTQGSMKKKLLSPLKKSRPCHEKCHLFRIKVEGLLIVINVC